MRVYSLLLILTASFAADSGNEPVSSLFSAVMVVFNLCVLFYNLFGKPRKYPSAKREKEESDSNAPPALSAEPAAEPAADEETDGANPLLPPQSGREEGGAQSPAPRT